ncbi:MAG: hypothetical protein ABIO39_13605 [Caulobacteraceae bacterium]
MTVPTLEVKVRRGREAEHFNTALYRFLELRLSNTEELDGHIQVTTEPAGDWEHKRLVLWSEEAAHDFAAFWRNLPEQRPKQRICA